MSPAPPEDDRAARPGPGADRDLTRTHVDTGRRLASGAILAGRYRVEELIGVGGMGMVYRVRDRQLDLDVALKVLRPEYSSEAKIVERFRRELVLARQVSHRNVVRIHDIGADGDLQFITMDFVPGRSLRKLLADEGPLPAARVVALARELAQALESAHLEGVVHRDLKPSNVMIDGSGRAYITDFGVARSLTEAGLTHTGAVVGTPDYLSPEQARGEKVGPPSDFYALGVMLFECLAGELPFAGGTYAEILAQRMAGARRTLSQLGVEAPRGLRAVVDRCLEADPGRRYQSAAEILADLEDPERAPPARGRWRLAAGLAAGLAIVIAALWLAGDRLGRVGGREDAGQGTAAVQGATRSLAVLPLADETGSAEMAWTSKGVAEMLASTLSESPALRVVDSSRVFRTLEDLRMTPESWTEAAISQLGELFEADRLVVGKVRSTESGLRIDARLVARGAAGEEVAVPLAPRVAAAADIGGLVTALRGDILEHLDVAEPRAPPPAPASAEAARAYSQGVELLARGDAVSALPVLRRAVAADPGFAGAWLRLSKALAAQGFLSEAEEAAERAVGAVGQASGRFGYEARAQQAMLRGESQRAEEILRELVARYPNDIESALALADAYGGAGKLPEAIALLEEAASRDPGHPRAWYLLAKYSILAGSSRKAVDDYLVRALVLQNKARNEQGKADVLNAFGVAYRELGDLEQAQENYAQAAKIREAIGDRRGYATTLRNLSMIDTLRGSFDAAESRLRDGLAILTEIGDLAGAADFRNDLGVLEEERGRYREALAHYRAALAERRDLGDKLTVALSLNNVGYAYFLLGEFDNASAYWQQALELNRELENREGIAVTMQSIGKLQLTRGEWDRALASYLEALEISRAEGFGSPTAVSLGNLARIAQYQGRYSAALSSFEEAIGILVELQHVRGETEFILGRAEVLAEVGRWQDAASELDRAARHLAETGIREQLAEEKRLRAALARAAGEPGRAAAGLDAALAEAEGSDSAVAALRVRIDRGLGRLGSRPAQGLAELESVLAEAESREDALLALRAGEGVARARLATGDLAGAERQARDTLRRAARVGTYARTFHLRFLLAEVLRAAGRASAAEEEARAGRAELERILAGLERDERRAFERRGEIAALLARPAPAAAARATAADPPARG